MVDIEKLIHAAEEKTRAEVGREQAERERIELELKRIDLEKDTIRSRTELFNAVTKLLEKIDNVLDNNNIVDEKVTLMIYSLNLLVNVISSSLKDSSELTELKKQMNEITLAAIKAKKYNLQVSGFSSTSDMNVDIGGDLVNERSTEN